MKDLASILYASSCLKVASDFMEDAATHKDETESAAKYAVAVRHMTEAAQLLGFDVVPRTPTGKILR